MMDWVFPQNPIGTFGTASKPDPALSPPKSLPLHQRLLAWLLRPIREACALDPPM